MLKKLLKNDYTFSLVARVVCIIFGFIYTVLLSRYLGASLRGEYSIVQNYATLAAVLLSFGIYQAYPYFKKKNPDKDNQKKLYKNITSNILGLFLIYLFICIFIVIFIPINFRIKMVLLIIPTSYLYKQINYILLIENPRICNITDVILSIFDIVVVTLLMFFTKANVFYCFAFLTIDKIVYAFLPVRNLKINFLKNPPKVDKEIKKYIRYGFIPMITIILMTVNHKVDIIMLSLFKDISTADIGIYSLGVLLAEKVWMLPDTLTNILQSKLANGKEEDEVAKISRISFTVTAFSLILVAILGKPLISFAYGSEYSGAYQITLIILLGVLGMTFYKVIYSYNVVNGKRKLNFIFLSLSVIINVALNLIFISNYKTIGAAIASLIAFIFCGFIFLVSFSHDTGIKIVDMIFLKKGDIELLKSLLKKDKIVRK